MPIDKFLCDVDLPQFHPGPFSVRLKYELKQLYFEKKVRNVFHFVYSSVILSLIVVCSLFIFKPQVPYNINSFVFNGEDTTLEQLLFAERGADGSNFLDNIRTLSSDLGHLPFIEEDRSYLIQRFRNNENQSLFYISEVKNQVQHRILY
jgi:hypothetical protein